MKWEKKTKAQIDMTVSQKSVHNKQHRYVSLYVIYKTQYQIHGLLKPDQTTSCLVFKNLYFMLESCTKYKYSRTRCTNRSADEAKTKSLITKISFQRLIDHLTEKCINIVTRNVRHLHPLPYSTFCHAYFQHSSVG